MKTKTEQRAAILALTETLLTATEVAGTEEGAILPPPEFWQSLCHYIGAVSQYMHEEEEESVHEAAARDLCALQAYAASRT